MQYTTPNALIEEIKKYVIGQNEAVQKVVFCFFQYLLYHYSKYSQDNSIANAPVCLLLGESGSGKTHIARTLATLTDSILIEINSKSISQEGWHGTSFKDLVIQGFKQFPQSQDESVYKIIFLDEFDKICQPLTSSNDNNFNIHIQNSLLKYIENYNIQDSKLNIDLSKCFFILTGNFQGLRDARESKNNQIGFKSHLSLKKDNINEELEEYGVLPELLGRISHIVELNQLTKDDYKAILYSENAYFKQYELALKHLNINISLIDSEINDILETIMELKIGVRGLIQELNKVIMNVLMKNQENLQLIVKYFNYLHKLQEKQDNNMKRLG